LLSIDNSVEVCEIVIESAALVSIIFALPGLPIYVAQFPLAPLIRSLPFSQPFAEHHQYQTTASLGISFIRDRT
jgi:hypothetical protein